MTIEPIEPFLEPVRKSVTVPRSVADAFELFTAGIGRWWPLAMFSLGQERARTCTIEPHVGGAVYEVRDDGERSEWGRVLVWEPPGRLVVTWHPGRPAGNAQEVEVRFTAEGRGTRVDLEHRNWQALGPDAGEGRDAYHNGWPGVLERYRLAASG